jgi:hypothetical protein
VKNHGIRRAALGAGELLLVISLLATLSFNVGTDCSA